MKAFILLFQIYGAFIISLGSLILGTLLGYPTIALPQWENGELVRKYIKKSHEYTSYSLILRITSMEFKCKYATL